jgi:RNase P subunit RPR2
MVSFSRKQQTSGDDTMKENTCAACDCELDSTRIAVKIGGKTVEVCCEECAEALREAEAAARTAQAGAK